jgi:hypothetical protein
MTRKNFHYGQTKAQRQADWMSRFSDHVVTLNGKLSGKIDWHTAQFFYDQGRDPIEAAQQYVNMQGE